MNRLSMRGFMALTIGIALTTAIVYLSPVGVLEPFAISLSTSAPELMFLMPFVPVIIAGALLTEVALFSPEGSVALELSRLLRTRFRSFAAKLFREGQQPVGSVGFSLS